MAVAVDDVRTDAMRARWRRVGMTTGDQCELCGKPMAPDGESHAAIDHERAEFVTEAEAEARGEAVSLYPIGADCARRVKRALKAEG